MTVSGKGLKRISKINCRKHMSFYSCLATTVNYKLPFQEKKLDDTERIYSAFTLKEEINRV